MQDKNCESSRHGPHAPYMCPKVEVSHRHKKADPSDRLKCLILLSKYGRDGVIRTLDP